MGADDLCEFFFFQAEDGIRDLIVTGVQTCALPIFIDCDAFGDLYEDYSPLHPASQEEDMKARLQRIAWIRDAYGLVIGSEGGSAYAASKIGRASCRERV